MDAKELGLSAGDTVDDAEDSVRSDGGGGTVDQRFDQRHGLRFGRVSGAILLLLLREDSLTRLRILFRIAERRGVGDVIVRW